MSPDELKKYINDFLDSKKYQNMLTGYRYYNTDNDIESRKFYFYDIKEEQKTDKYRSNVKISNNFFATIVDQLTSYCFSKDIIIDDFPTLKIDINEDISDVAEEACQKAVGWTYIYVDENGELKTKVMNSEQIIEIRDGTLNNLLVYVIRLYSVNEVKFAEVWDDINVTTYELKKDKGYELIEQRTHLDNNESWNMIPFIPFYYNRYETTALKPIKGLIDAYDYTISDFANNFIDFQEIIYFVKNYAENVSTPQAATEIMNWLKKYKIINVKEDGDIDILRQEVPYQARGEFLQILKKLIFTFGQGVDIDDLKGSSLTNVVVKAHFALLDMKSNKFIKQSKKYIKEMLKIDNRWNELKSQPTSELTKAKQTYNKSIIINETEIIEGNVKSDGIISRKTNISNHPWVDDVEEELKLIDEDEEQYKEENPFEEVNVNEDIDLV